MTRTYAIVLATCIVVGDAGALVRCARGATLGADIYAIGEGVLPSPGTILSATIAESDQRITYCLGGWAQNWSVKANNLLSRMPAIGLYVEPGHYRICPSLQVGNTVDSDGKAHTKLSPDAFTMPAWGSLVRAGDMVAVEVDVQGACPNGIATAAGSQPSCLIGGGEMWLKAVGVTP